MKHVSDEDVRGKTHGDFTENATIAQALKDVMHSSAGWGRLSPAHKECLDLDATKTARILAGDGSFADHWNDKEGYARLGKDRV